VWFVAEPPIPVDGAPGPPGPVAAAAPDAVELEAVGDGAVTEALGDVTSAATG
jgi:hypothetical protein